MLAGALELGGFIVILAVGAGVGVLAALIDGWIRGPILGVLVFVVGSAAAWFASRSGFPMRGEGVVGSIFGVFGVGAMGGYVAVRMNRGNR